MTSPHDHNHDEPLDRAVLLRCAADDELTEAQDAQLRAHLRDHPEDKASIAFERSLRGACARVMDTPPCPEALRQRIEAMASGAALQADQTRAHDAHAGDPAQSPRGRAGSGRRGQSRSMQRRMINAVAASIALIFGGAFLWQMILLSGPDPSVAANAAYVTNFVGTEHDLCETDPTRTLKFSIHKLDETPAALSNILGKSPTLPDLIATGLRFRDGGECAVPGGGRSVHLRFETDGSAGPAGVPVSLFIQHGLPTRVRMEPDVAYRLTAQSSGQAQTTPIAIYGWYADGLTYYLVTEDEAEARRVCDLMDLASEGS